MVLSYRQVVHAYPSGGGDYEVAMKNHGQFAALVVASALLVDYVLTVAVSVSSGTDNIISAFPSLNQHRVLIAVGLVALLAAANLRGLRESGKTFAVPTYLFATGIMIMIVTGLIRQFFGDADRRRERAATAITPDAAHTNLTGLALLFFALRAFASGTTALTGIEAVANGVPAFKPPKSRNAATTLALLGGIAATMFAGVTALALLRARPVRRPVNACDLEGFAELRDRAAAHGHRPARRGHLRRRHARSASSTSRPRPPWSWCSPRTPRSTASRCSGSVLAQDRFLPRQLHTRGDKLVYSNGILLLAGFAVPADLRVRRRRHPADPALHHRGVHQLQHRPVGHGPALEPGDAHRARPAGRAGGCAARRSSTPSADR